LREKALQGLREKGNPSPEGANYLWYVFKLALERECQHIYEYCVGTNRIILPRGFLIGYGISRVGKAQIQTMNRQIANLY